MKKLIFAIICLTFLSVSSLYAQKGGQSGNAPSVAGQAPASNARGKTPSKGSPLLQRQSEAASEAPSSVAPAAPAAAKVSPTTPRSNAILRDSVRNTKAAPANGGSIILTPKE